MIQASNPQAQESSKRFTKYALFIKVGPVYLSTGIFIIHMYYLYPIPIHNIELLSTKMKPFGWTEVIIYHCTTNSLSQISIRILELAVSATIGIFHLCDDPRLLIIFPSKSLIYHIMLSFCLRIAPECFDCCHQRKLHLLMTFTVSQQLMF